MRSYDVRACVRAFVRACVRACVRASVRACVHAFVRACLRECSLHGVCASSPDSKTDAIDCTHPYQKNRKFDMTTINFLFYR